jgi:hypothetical protein
MKDDRGELDMDKQIEDKDELVKQLRLRVGEAESLGPRSTNRFHMYRGSRIKELVASGLELDACCLELDACRLFFNKLGA